MYQQILEALGKLAKTGVIVRAGDFPDRSFMVVLFTLLPAAHPILSAVTYTVSTCGKESPDQSCGFSIYHQSYQGNHDLEGFLDRWHEYSYEPWISPAQYVFLGARVWNGQDMVVESSCNLNAFCVLVKVETWLELKLQEAQGVSPDDDTNDVVIPGDQHVLNRLRGFLSEQQNEMQASARRLAAIASPYSMGWR